MGLKRMGRRHEGPEHDTQRPRWRTVWSEEPSTSQVRLWCGRLGSWSLMGRWATVQMWMDYTKMVASILLQEARPSLVKTALSPSL